MMCTPKILPPTGWRNAPRRSAGKEAALFVPTGTMGNTIAIKLLTEHGEEVVCDSRAHLLDWELSMLAWFSGCLIRPAETKDVITLASKEYKGELPANIQYMKCDDEYELLQKFSGSGHMMITGNLTSSQGGHVESFDIKYLVRRIVRLFDEKIVNLLSPNNWVREREIVKGKNIGAAVTKETVYDLSGIATLDYIELYKRFNYTSTVNHMP